MREEAVVGGRESRRRLSSARRIGVGAALVVMSLAAGGSGLASGAKTDAQQKRYTLGISMPFLSSDFQVVMQKRLVATAKQLGIKYLPPTNADMDSAKQIADIRNLISAGATGLIVVANDSKAIIPALKYAAQKGVKVVSIDIGPDGGKLAMIVRADNVGMGRIACRWMGKKLGGKGKVLSNQGAQTSINGRDRTKGFHDCMKQEFPNIQLIERPTDWDPAKQVANIQTVLTANPDLGGIYMQSDWALSASLAAIKQAGHGAKVGQPGHVYTISIDASPLGLKKIKEGVLDAEISQPLDLYVKHGLQYLQGAIDGNTWRPGTTNHNSRIVRFSGNLMDLVAAKLVTRANVNDRTLWANQK
jgi:ribose transport system substrate-binding protein